MACVRVQDGPDKLALVLEFCAHGSVTDLMRSARQHSWRSTYYRIVVGVGRCFKYLHHEQRSGLPVIHRDLKPANILINSDYSAKVADFGESKQFDTKLAMQKNAERGEEEGRDVLTMTVAGTPMFCAPLVTRALTTCVVL